MQLDKIYLGDCLEIMPQIPDNSVDLILCDLPYESIRTRWDKLIDIKALWKQYLRVVNENSVVVLFGIQPFTSYLVNSNLEHFKYSYVWSKRKAGNFVSAKHQPLKTHEDILVFGFKPITYNKRGSYMRYNPQMKKGEAYVRDNRNRKDVENLQGQLKRLVHVNSTGDRYPTTILEYPTSSDPESGMHPTQKPIALFEYLIRTYSNEGQTVLDNCIGSGTTAVACLNTNRRFIGIEKDPIYYNMAIKRIAKHTPNSLI
jgi:site-specific DNA-methyltransferase (adenine-specific)